MEIKVENVQKKFHLKEGQTIRVNGVETDEIQILQDFNLSVRDGEFLVLVGPSGCGKSVFLDMLGGLTNISSGRISIDGEDVTAPHPQLAYVFQQYALFPWRTAISNIEYPLEIRQVESEERHEKSSRLLSLIGLNGFEQWLPYQLSGGMQQRVAIARSLSTDPQVLLMDEPFAALDTQTREILQVELLRIWGGIKNTVIFVTHSIEEAVFLADRVVIMAARPGKTKKIVDIGLPRPREDSVRNSEEFARYRQEIWEELKDEVAKAQRDWELSSIYSKR